MAAVERHLRPLLSRRFMMAHTVAASVLARFPERQGPHEALTHHHTGSVVDEDTCALFVAIERDTCSTQLPPNFTWKIRLLPANTLLHTPSSCRLRMIATTAQCWNDFALLEEGRSKLLLASVPSGLGTATEVAKRLTLWEESRFEDLLRHAEEQLLTHRKSGKRKKRDAQPDPLTRADRARRKAAVGAYRKATTGLVSSMLSFQEKDDLM